MCTDEVILEMFFIFHRKFEFSFGIHDINFRDVEEAMVFSGLYMVFGSETLSGVGCVAFYYCSVYFLHQILDQ